GGKVGGREARASRRAGPGAAAAGGVRRAMASPINTRGRMAGAALAAALALLAAPAAAQEAANVGALAGTLKKVKDSGTITLGYRESSLPFSYLNRRQQPI